MKTYKNLPRPLFGICFFFLSLLFTIFYTFPLIADLSGTFYGFPWDSLGGIRHFWWLKFTNTNNLPLLQITYLSYPFGRDLSNDQIPYLFYLTTFLVTYLTTNEIVAFNILKFISFPLLTLTTYLLVFYLTRHRAVSIIIGLVYTFSPFHVIHNMAHFTNLYWLPVAILFLLKFLKEGGYKNGILFGLFWGTTFVDNTYYAYFLCLLIPIFLLAYLLNTDKRENFVSIPFLKAFLVSFCVFFAIIFPMVYPILKGIFFTQSYKATGLYVLKRAFSDLFIFSAKPLDYLLPSKHNPFLGWLIPDFGISPLKGHRYTEHTLYLGYSLILLGGYALYSAIKKRDVLGRNDEERRTVYLFFIITIVCVILSAPPFIPLGSYHVDFQTREVIAEHKIYLPQYFLYKLFPMFRVYARIGAIVLLAVCILAAFGLRKILTKIKTKNNKLLFVSLFSLVVFVEYAEFPSFRLTKVREPEVYKWLASQPGQFPIVEYPLGAGDDPYTTYEYSFYQRIHKKYLINGAIAGTPADEFRKKVIDISKDETIDNLSRMGVKYILVHKDKYVKGNEYVPLDWLTQPPRDKLFPVEYNDGKIPNLPIKRVRLIKDFGGVAVYEPVQGF